MKSRLLRAQDVALCLVRKWWRPITLCGVAAGTFVNLVYLPLRTGQSPNLAEAGAWIAAVSGLSWVREWGKSKGASE